MNLMKLRSKVNVGAGGMQGRAVVGKAQNALLPQLSSAMSPALKRRAGAALCRQPPCVLTRAAQVASAGVSSELAPESPPSGIESSTSEMLGTDPMIEDTKQGYPWARQWYPIVTADDVDLTRPYPFLLLGMELVLWKDNKGTWSCLADACPHRLVPLSEGRIEPDGTLLCAYHAWRFDASGKCTSIPQTETPELEAKHFSNPRSCATSYPIREVQGMLWVFPTSGMEGTIYSEATPLRLISELEDPSMAGRVKPLPWSWRDLPYDYTMFIENVVDPAHVPVTHHGIVGDRYKDAKYYDMVNLQPLTLEQGTKYETIRTMNNSKSTTEFLPPCLVKITTENADGSKLILMLYASPTKPGYCRHVGCQVFIASPEGNFPKGLGFFGLPMPTSLLHVLAPLFLHQDMVFLHHGQYKLAKELASGKRAVDAYWTPNPQDKMVLAFRRWFETMAQGVAWAPGTQPLDYSLGARIHEDQLFDTFDAHTKNCRHCSAAVVNIRNMQWGLGVVAVICVLQGMVWSIAASMATAATAAVQAAVGNTAIAVSSPVFAMPPAPAVAVSALAAALLGVVVLLEKLRGMFYEYRFRHADNN